MTKTMQYDHHVMIEDIKPIIDDQAIYFPLSVKNGYVKEDGFSLGHPVDCGNYATVTFERAVGVLADDTVALYHEFRTRKNSKETRFDLSEYVKFRVVDGWDAGLPPLAEHEHDDNYWTWSSERRNAWDKAHYVGKIDAEPLFTLDGQSLWHTKDGFFKQTRPIFDNIDSGKITTAELIDGLEIDDILAIAQAKIDLIARQNKVAQELKANINSLSTVFGYKAKV